MRTNTGRNLLAIATVLVFCIVAAWFCPSIRGGERTYEVRPEITLPEYKTDTIRAIETCERLMERFISMTERNLTGVNRDLRDVAKKLDSIDRKLTELSARMTGIEKALGVGESKVPLAEKPTVEVCDHSNKSESESQE